MCLWVLTYLPGEEAARAAPVAHVSPRARTFYPMVAGGARGLIWRERPAAAERRVSLSLSRHERERGACAGEAGYGLSTRAVTSRARTRAQRLRRGGSLSLASFRFKFSTLEYRCVGSGG